MNALTRLIKGATIAAIVLFLLFLVFVGNAGANTILKNEESCQALANFAQGSANIRDTSGASWEEAQISLIDTMMRLTGPDHPESWIRDIDDAELVLALAEAVWKSDRNAHELGVLVYMGCTSGINRFL